VEPVGVVDGAQTVRRPVGAPTAPFPRATWSPRCVSPAFIRRPNDAGRYGTSFTAPRNRDRDSGRSHPRADRRRASRRCRHRCRHALAALGDVGAALNGLPGLVLALAYFTHVEETYGRTLGKWLLGIVVMGENGGPCTMEASAVRNLLRLVDNFPGERRAPRSDRSPLSNSPSGGRRSVRRAFCPSSSPRRPRSARPSTLLPRRSPILDERSRLSRSLLESGRNTSERGSKRTKAARADSAVSRPEMERERVEMT